MWSTLHLSAGYQCEVDALLCVNRQSLFSREKEHLNKATELLEQLLDHTSLFPPETGHQSRYLYVMVHTHIHTLPACYALAKCEQQYFFTSQLTADLKVNWGNWPTLACVDDVSLQNKKLALYGSANHRYVWTFHTHLINITTICFILKRQFSANQVDFVPKLKLCLHNIKLKN